MLFMHGHLLNLFLCIQNYDFINVLPKAGSHNFVYVFASITKTENK